MHIYIHKHLYIKKYMHEGIATDTNTRKSKGEAEVKQRESKQAKKDYCTQTSTRTHALAKKLHAETHRRAHIQKDHIKTTAYTHALTNAYKYHYRIHARTYKRIHVPFMTCNSAKTQSKKDSRRF